MAAVYPKAKEKMLDSSIGDLTSVNVKVAVVGSGYTYDAAHDNFDDLTDVHASSGNLTGKAITSGVFTADSPTVTATNGDIFDAVVCYIDTGTPSTSTLLSYEDRDASLNPLNYTTDGSAETIVFPSDRIFSI